MRRVCKKGLVATAVRISCCQEQSLRRKHTHCSVYRGFLQSPRLFHLRYLIVQSIVKVASADYLSRHLIENTLNLHRCLFHLHSFQHLPVTFVALTGTQDPCDEQYPCSYSCQLTNFFWTWGAHPTFATAEDCVPARYLKPPSALKSHFSPPRAVGVCWPWLR